MENKKVIRKRNAGFTLVEMVVVISILGVLSSIGLMKFGEVQEESKLKADCVTAQNIASAYELAKAQDNIEGDSNIVGQLVTNNYMSSEPISQIIKEGKFEVDVTGDKTIVKVGLIEFYPTKPDLEDILKE